MNTSEDWDVIWKWQWFRRALWQPHYRDPAHPEGRPARTAPVWQQILKDHGAVRVLDCSCGLGLRSMLLQEAGFQVVGTDISPVAIRHARELAEFHDLPVEYDQCARADLGTRFADGFDAAISEAVAWIPSHEELRVAAQGVAAALRPGGVLIITGPDQWSTPDDRAHRVEQAWVASPRFQIRANYGHGDIYMTLVVARDREEYGITENYLFLIHEGGATRLETASIRTSMEWTWSDLHQICADAGFASFETVTVVAAGREHHLNVARKSQ